MNGVRSLCLTEENKKDIKENKRKYLKGLKFVYVNDMMGVINAALLKEKVSNPVTV